ncbi:hypothetical protein RIF29_29675 [Crotalaria pallida]|uniref:Uncharacterized protein n=1 Tax=Crotalaria pallida TaxID=3830 RepID=A0AAN9EFA9_CROPI
MSSLLGFLMRGRDDVGDGLRLSFTSFLYLKIWERCLMLASMHLVRGLQLHARWVMHWVILVFLLSVLFCSCVNNS